MAMKPVLTLLSVLVLPSFGILAQQPTSAGPPAVPADVEAWMRAAWGMDPQVLGKPIPSWNSPQLLIAYAALFFDGVVSIVSSRFNASRSLGRCR